MKSKKIIIIVGPTASGKSALTHALAKKYGSEIISADSRLIYKKMNIGTAKPTKEELSEINYHCLNLIEPCQDYSLGKYLENAQPKLKGITEKYNFAFVVGGTGFYLKGLLENLFLPEIGPNLKLRQKVKDQSTESLYAELKNKDLENKWKMHFNDRLRIIRALEIELVHEKKDLPFINLEFNNFLAECEIIWLGLNFDLRDKLRAKIKRRTELMLQSGLIEETQTLINEYGQLDLFAKTIGYAECLNYLNKQILSTDELLNKIIISTSQYAKRQITWFKSNKNINWLNPESPNLLPEAESYINL